MCNKINFRVECYKCGYPYSEARYPDNLENPLPCDSPDAVIIAHIKEEEKRVLSRND